MKFIHLSDLHIGKRINEYSLIEDQKYILKKIVEIIREKKPDCVFMAGDIYDKSVPSAEAVSLLDDFLYELAKADAKVYIISGNHDNSERLAYAARVFESAGIYIAPAFEGKVLQFDINDGYGRVNIYLLPFLRPAMVKRYFELDSDSYTDAIDTVIKSLKIDKSVRNVILSHQYVSGASRCDSEEEAIGGLDMVEGWVYDDFDYTALGHIHRAQKIGKEKMMYSGTPLKYSSSESDDVKCIIWGELKEKGELYIEKIPLASKRDYKVFKGTLAELSERKNTNDYVKIVLTDKESVVDAYGKLKEKYPFMTELVFEREHVYQDMKSQISMDKSPEEQFFEFYKTINSSELNDEQKKTVADILTKLKESAE